MGRSAKGYKKPTLKEKQQTRKTKSVLSQDEGLKDWSAPSSTVRAAASAIQAGPSQSSSRRGASRPVEQKAKENNGDAEHSGLSEDEDEDDEDAAAAGEAASSATGGSSTTHDRARKKKSLRAKSKTSRSGGATDVAGDDARTPRDQGIDYLGLWAGRKKEIVSARIKQGRSVKGSAVTKQ